MIGMADHPKSNVAEMRLTSSVAQSRIRKIAENSENVILGNHARDRMIEREILDVDVFRIIRSGHVEGQPEYTDFKEWKCKVVLKIRGSRTAGVVVVLLHSGKLFVKTVEWES
jgi:hypothetical protein